MTTNADTSETMLAPDDAFAVLGNETRMEILQTLGEADEPLPFSELRGRVGMRDSGQFNYHLGKLDGHFIKDTDGGYALGQKGSRVIEAVLSGAVTDTPVLDRTPVDMSCYCCGATPIEFDYHDERLGVYCSECAGLYDTDGHDHAAEQEGGFHGHAPIPPAALQDRTPEELILAAITWWVGETVMIASSVCPRCSAPVAESVTVCENHDATDGLCDRCGSRYAAIGLHRCTNCPYERSGILGRLLVANADLRAFFADHGIDIFSPSAERFMGALLNYDEEILATDPFKSRFTFTIDEDTISLTVDDELSVIETSDGTAEEAA